MRPLRRLSCIALLGLAAGAIPPFAAAAEPAAPRDGEQYLTLPSRLPTDTGKRIEVIEFFAYYCPHCFAFEPALSAWVQKQGDAIAFKRVHVPRGEPVLAQQRLFYTLDAMGLLPQYHRKVFDAMHVDHLNLRTDQEVFDWVAKNGIDRAKFVDAYRSFGIQAKLNRASAMMEQYAVDRWPLIAIDGRWVTSPSHAGQGVAPGAGEAAQQQAALQVMDYLVAKAKADQR